MADGLARSYNWINLALLPAYIARPLLLIAGVSVLWAVGFHLDATTVLAVLVMAAWLSVLAQMLQLNRRLKSVTAAGEKRYAPRQWFATALPIMLVWGLYTLLISTDILVLKQFRPADEVAHYYAAAKTIGLVSIIYFAFAATSAHRFTAHHISGDKQELAQFAASIVRWVFWLSLALTVVLVAAGRPILMLFGADFVSAYPIMLILAIGQLARASIGPAERVLNVLGQQRKCALAYVVAFGFNFSACVLLAPGYGAIGVAAATAGAFVVESALLFMIARRGLGLHMFVWRPAERRQTIVNSARLTE
jgi:O-antigen/teichoic acid export membrane protein